MEESKLKTLLGKEMSRKEFFLFSLLAVGSAFGFVGLIRELSSHATTATATIEPEIGTISGGSAKAINDTTASGGKAVVFAKTTTPPSTSIKGNYGGLFTSTEANRASYSPPLGQFWLKANWTDLEPTQGVYDWSSIDNYLNLPAHATTNVRIHVKGGQLAPVSGAHTWLAGISGGTVSVKNSKDVATAPCGLFWKPAYMTAYANFVAAMGARYDSNPRVLSINNAGCSLIYDEPWIMGGDPTSCIDMYNAGLNKTTQQTAIYNALDALMAAWPTTIIEMPVHSQMNYPISSGQGGNWNTDGLPAANLLHTTYGQRLIITDYGLGPGEYEDAASSLASAPSVYSWMHKRSDLGYPIAFQATFGTYTYANVVSGTQAAIDMGGRWFETSSWSALSNAEVQSYNTALKANTP